MRDVPTAPKTLDDLVKARKSTLGLVGLLCRHVPSNATFILGSVYRNPRTGRVFAADRPRLDANANVVFAEDVEPMEEPPPPRGLEKPRRFQRSPRGSGIRVWA